MTNLTMSKYLSNFDQYRECNQIISLNTFYHNLMHIPNIVRTALKLDTAK